MKTTLQKLTDKLCECEAVRKQLDKSLSKKSVFLQKGFENPELRHLMMYCEKNKMVLRMNGHGYLWTTRVTVDKEDICKLDNTLPFHEQPEETLKLILDFLNR